MLTNPCEKYSPYPPIALPDRRWPERQITTAPRWLSTDLRDGNRRWPNQWTPRVSCSSGICCWSAVLKK